MENDVKKQNEVKTRENEAQKATIQSIAMNNTSRNTVIWICVAVFVLFAIVFSIIRFSGKNADGNLEKLDEKTETVTGTGENRETFKIPFEGLVLKYPKEWKDQVTAAKRKDGSLAFSADGTPLFTLYADGSHSVLGTVISDKNTVISAEFAEIDPKDVTKAAMAEDINVIIHHLAEDYNFEVGTIVETEDTSTFPIKTSLTTLYYPSKWKDQVTIEVTDKKVSFSDGETPLFDLVFASCDGYMLGSYNNTPIYIVEYSVTNQEHAEMQMGVNTILEHLQEDDKFSVSG